MTAYRPVQPFIQTIHQATETIIHQTFGQWMSKFFSCFFSFTLRKESLGHIVFLGFLFTSSLTFTISSDLSIKITHAIYKRLCDALINIQMDKDWPFTLEVFGINLTPCPLTSWYWIVKVQRWILCWCFGGRWYVAVSLLRNIVVNKITMSPNCMLVGVYTAKYFKQLLML
jgi:hypothetical protein